MKTIMEHKETYIVKEVVDECERVKTLKLALSDGSQPSYAAGQFITVYFPETKTLEGKAYTFSSAPHEELCAITIKKVGEFSGKLCAMKPGDAIEASLPYGFFASDILDSEIIALAGGIGVTPFRSIILNALKENPGRCINLHYSSKTLEDIAFKAELDALSKEHENFRITYYLTQEDVVSGDVKKGRMRPQDIASSPSRYDNKEFLICGSIAFVRDMWKELKDSGVPEHHIYTEAFF